MAKQIKKAEADPLEENKPHIPTAEEIAAYEKQLQAGKRMLQLKKAKDNLIEFVKLMMPDPGDPDDHTKSRYDDQPHHHFIAGKLQDLEAGRIQRLIITMPPRAGKSELASKKFPAWASGRDPYRSIIFATYSDTFAEDTGRKVRDTMKGKLFQQVFPACRLKKGSAAADRIETEEGGISAFVGAGGAITGRGGNILILDDPIKGREEADSPAFRQKQWEWFNDVFMSRLADDSAVVIIIATRWHEDDIIGRLTDPKNECYRKEEAVQWEVLELPAIARENDPMGRQPGESIWPGKFSAEFYFNIKRRNPRGYSALYDQRPTPEEGVFFNVSWLRGYEPDEFPKNPRWYAASDHAVSVKQDADYTVLGCGATDEAGVLWIPPDIFWRKAPTDTVVEAFGQQISAHHPLFWWAEKGHISQSIGPFLRKYLLEHHLFCSIIEMTPSRDKQTRAQSIAGRMAMGMVRFPFFAPWWPDAKDQLLKFPSSKHDDFVDWLAWFGIGLDTQVRAAEGQNVADKEPKPGTMAWIKMASKWQKDQTAAASRGGF